MKCVLEKIEAENRFIKFILVPFHRWPHLITYWCFGIITAAIDLSIFSLLVEVFSVYYIISNCISVSVGICVSFYLNSKYNFKVTDKKAGRFTLFFIVGVCGIIVSNAILYTLTEWAGLFYFIGKMVSLVTVSLCKFTFNKFVTFKKTISNESIR